MARNIFVVSDLHCGCRLGLCPPGEVKLDDGGMYQTSSLQQKMWSWWVYLIREWLPVVTRNEDFVFVVNGDAIDGNHHDTVTQISHNIIDQIRIAESILSMVIENPKCLAYYHLRGTEAHAGKSGQAEEDLAERLEAKRDTEGRFARWELWYRMTKNNSLINFTHHIGTTSSMAYESTAVHKELVEMYNEAGRWGDEPPDVVVRSHRHRYYKTEVPSEKGHAISLVTPGWQLKTPLAFRISSGRSGMPHMGGVLIREGDEQGENVYTRYKVFKIDRPKEERDYDRIAEDHDGRTIERDGEVSEEPEERRHNGGNGTGDC